MDPFAAARFLLGGAFLAYAAASDLRTRRVRVEVWAVLGILAFLLLAFNLLTASADIDQYALVIATGIFYASLFLGAPILDEKGLHFRAIRLGGFALALVLVLTSAARAFALSGQNLVSYEELLSMPIMVIVFDALYVLRLLHGGADLLCFATLAVLLPTYPDVSPLPIVATDPLLQSALRIWFPFSLVILIDAAIIEVITVPVANLCRNLLHHDYGFPEMIIGFRANLNPLPPHVWLIERVRDGGEHVLVLLPKRTTSQEDEAEKLRRIGMKKAWVQPQTPMMPYILAGLVVALIIGNFFIAFLTAAFPRS